MSGCEREALRDQGSINKADDAGSSDDDEVEGQRNRRQVCCERVSDINGCVFGIPEWTK